MRATFLHLSGGRRGEAEVFQQEWLQIGSHPECDLELEGRSVSPFHAAIRYENCEYLLRDLGSADGTFVNGSQVSEILLQDGDVIEVGAGGPKLRFRTHPDDHARCKPLRRIFTDARDLAREYGGGPLRGASTFLRQALVEIVREYSWRLGIAALVFLLLSGGVSVILLQRSHQERLRREQVLAELAGKVQETGRLRERLLEAIERQKDLEVKLGERFEDINFLQMERARLQEDLRETEAKTQASQTEIRRIREALATAEKRIRSLEEAKVAAARIIKRYAGGVAFIQGSFTLEDPSGQPLRWAGRDEEGKPLFFPGGEGEVFAITFSGTGFLVGADGRLLTNRHIAEPWWNEEALRPLLARGMRPRLLDLRAFFPGRPEAFPLEVMAVSEDADVAVIRLTKSADGLHLPVLPVDHSGNGAKPGSPVLLLGYPAGLAAILAKLDPGTLRAVFETAGDDVQSVTAEVGRRGLIRPLATQGIIGDVTSTDLVYDAQTTVGGSGGPLFNMEGRVIGINRAILRRFGGSNFATPIRFGVPLLAGVPRKE